MSDISRILSAVEAGDPAAAGHLLPLVYEELRQLAAARLSREAPGQTLQPTALVHEAYLRLVGRVDTPRWDGRGHFFAAAAEAMRRILIEAARRKNGTGREPRPRRRDIDPLLPAVEPSDQLLLLNDALERFAAIDPRAAEVVKLRYFGGLTLAEAAAVLGISDRTADADWAYARAWLVAALRDGD